MFNSSSRSEDTALTHVRLRDFYETAANILIPVDDRKVYLPERSWTRTFSEGLQKCGLAQSCTLEVGVGSGVNMAGLILSQKPPREFIGTDIAADAVSASRDLARSHNMNVTLLESDLLNSLEDSTLLRLDNIIGCIPQVPRHKCEIASDREKSDYYEETGIKEDLYGLGLNARLLDQVKVRAPHVTVTLNIAGRPGMERITDMFESRSLKADIVHARIVRQDPGTSLASLAEIEENSGQNFHFFADSEGRKEINAHEAEERREKGVPIFHNLYVIQARL